MEPKLGDLLKDNTTMRTSRAVDDEGPVSGKRIQSPEALEAIGLGHVSEFIDKDALQEVKVYQQMFLSRVVDETLMDFAKRGRLPFAIVGAGQELAQIRIANELKPGDAVRGYYRNGPTDITIGAYSDIESIFAQAFGDTKTLPNGELADPASGGRMMNNHAGSRTLGSNGNFIDQSTIIFRGSDVSSTGSQVPVARGLGLASHFFSINPELSKVVPFNTKKDVVVVNIGDSAVAEGFVLGAINQISVDQGLGRETPTIVHILDNQYGITVPSKYQVNGNWANVLSGFGIRIMEADGNDFESSKNNYAEAVRYAREERKPIIVVSRVTQPFGHSLDGDHRRYKSEERLKYDTTQDCITRTRELLINKKLLSETQMGMLEESIRKMVTQAAETAYENYYKPVKIAVCDLTPLLEELEQVVADADVKKQIKATYKKWTNDTTTLAMGPDIIDPLEKMLIQIYGSNPNVSQERCYAKIKEFILTTRNQFENNYKQFVKPNYVPGVTVGPKYEGEKLELDQQSHIISAFFASEMANDPRIVIFGEDTGKAGGVKSTTRGLQEGHNGVGVVSPNGQPTMSNTVLRFIPENGFGAERIFDHGIDESSIIATAVGLALRGLKPVVELQYADYMIYGLPQMKDEVNSTYYRTAGGQIAPVLIRTAGHRQMGMWHTGSPMSEILPLKGVHILVPRDAVQAIGMYRAALKGNTPTISIEPLEDLAKKIPVPTNIDKIEFPLGQSEVLHEGSKITIVTYGACCKYAVEAAKILKTKGISIEVVDLQTLSPLDLNKVAKNSVAKTGKLIMLDEDLPNTSGPMLVTTLKEDGMVDCEVKHITAINGSPYSRDGKHFGKPQAMDIVKSVCEMIGVDLY